MKRERKNDVKKRHKITPVRPKVGPLRETPHKQRPLKNEVTRELVTNLLTGSTKN